MTKFERFYSWMAEHRGNLNRELAKAILETPRSEMADFELALAGCKSEDDLKVLKQCVGMLEGDWRRSMVAKKICQLQPGCLYNDERIHFKHGRDNARDFAMAGGIALRPWGHDKAELYDQNAVRLQETLSKLGMKTVVIHYQGKKSQHALIYGKPLELALAQAVKE